MIQPANITSGLQELVEQLETLPPRELEDCLDAVRERAGSVRHLSLAALLAAARNLDWAPFDAAGTLDLTPATARHVETLSDRLPVGGREQLARLYTLAVAHRIHVAGENAPFVLPEIAPDLDRMKDPKATLVEVVADLQAGAVTRALHGWPCCSGRAPWSAVTEALAGLALTDGATLGARATAAASLRRILEIVGREHRHPVITALFRALAAAPRGDDPTPTQNAALDGVESPDELRDPAAGNTASGAKLSAAMSESEQPETLAGERIRAGDSLATVMGAAARAAAWQALSLRTNDPALHTWCAETLVAVNSLRDIDGHEDGWLRPRVVIEAARVLGARQQAAAARGASFTATPPAPATDADPERLRQALTAEDTPTTMALAAALAASPMHAAEAVQIMDSHGVSTGFDPADLSPLRAHVAATDEYRRTPDPAAAASFLSLAASRCGSDRETRGD